MAAPFKLDRFTLGYVEAMVWTDCNCDSEELADKDCDDFAPETWAKIKADCDAFQAACADDIAAANEAGRDDDYLGHDFWLTRNGHGTGFWDRRELEADGVGARLDAACGYGTAFRGVDLYLGDDGLVYMM